MKDKKGQALIEFVIIIPILLLILSVIIDFGFILYEKNKLENVSTDISNLYKEKGSLNKSMVLNITRDKNIKYQINVINDHAELIVYKKINMISPILKSIDGLDNIETKRIIYYE